MIKKLFICFSRTTKSQQKLFCSSKQQEQLVNNANNFKQQKNKLKFIYLTSTLGGAIIGASIASYFYYHFYIETTESKEIQTDAQYGNLSGFKAQWNEDWDGKQQQYLNSKAENKKQGTKYITLIRHGQYVLDKQRENRKLTELGKLQSKICGQRLKDLNTSNFDKIFVSNVVRAQETCEIVRQFFPNAEVCQDPNLAEGSPCIVYPERSSVNSDLESLAADGPRISTAFETYFSRCDTEKDENILFVIHGNVIRYFLCRALQFPVEGWLRFSVYNTGISQLSIRPGGHVSVRTVGDVGHLQKEQITYH